MTNAQPHPNSKEAQEAKRKAKEAHPIASAIAAHIANNETEFALEAWTELNEQEATEVWRLFNMMEKEFIRSIKNGAAA